MKINPKQMQAAMKRMGIQQVEVPATQVIIHCGDYDLVFDDAQVSKVNMMGQETYQITGTPHQVAKKISISEDDIQTVMDQAKVDADAAKDALENNEGDLAAAILSLQ